MGEDTRRLTAHYPRHTSYWVMVVVDIDIKNNPNILERLIKALKSPRFQGWSIRPNAQWPNPHWDCYPNKTPRFFRFDFEMCKFQWQCDDDQAFVMEGQEDVRQLLTTDQMESVLDFVACNTSLFHNPQDPDVLSALFNEFFAVGDDVDEKASSQPYSVHQPRPPKKKETWHPIHSWAINEENAYITVSKEQLEKLYTANPPFYHESTLAPAATHDLNYAEYVKLMDSAKVAPMGQLQKILQTIEGLHGPYADPLRSFLKARIECLQKEELAVQANLQAHYYPYVGYEHKKSEKLVLPKLKKLKFPEGKAKTVTVGDKTFLFDPPYSTVSPDNKPEFAATAKMFEKLKKLASEVNVPIMVAASQPNNPKSPWAMDIETFADAEMKKDFNDSINQIYQEYFKMLNYDHFPNHPTPNPVAPSYPKYESEYMAEWPTSHSVAAAYNKHYPMK